MKAEVAAYIDGEQPTEALQEFNPNLTSIFLKNNPTSQGPYGPIYQKFFKGNFFFGNANSCPRRHLRKNCSHL